MVKRYDVETMYDYGHDGCGYMDENELGYYVTYKDYAALLDVAREMAEDLEEINDANQVYHLGSDGEITARDVSEKALARFKEFDNEY